MGMTLSVPFLGYIHHCVFMNQNPIILTSHGSVECQGKPKRPNVTGSLPSDQTAFKLSIGKLASALNSQSCS